VDGVKFLHGMQIPPEHHLRIAEEVSRMTREYQGIMLVKAPAEIMPQLKKEATVAAVIERPEGLELVGFVTLWDLKVEGVLELGTLGVFSQYQGLGIGTELVRIALTLNGKHRIIATAKTSKAITALIHGGMAMWDFTSLPLAIRATTCCCSGELGVDCTKADGACRLLKANWSKKT